MSKRPELHPIVLWWLSTLVHAEWRHASASQIKRYLRCARAWWFEKVGKAPEYGDKPWLTAGKTHHASAERYGLTGETPTLEIQAGLQFLPAPPWGAENIERRFAIWLPGWPVPIVGYIDLIEPNHATAYISPHGGVTLARGRVTDHKTSRSFAHMCTTDELLKEIQGLIYGIFTGPIIEGTEVFAGYVYTDQRDNEYPVFYVSRATTAIEFRHIVYKTFGPKAIKRKYEAREVRVVLGPEVLNQAIDDLGETLVRMRADSLQRDPRDVLPTITACDDYGGCAFRQWCHHFGEPVLFGVPEHLKDDSE